MLRIVAGMNQKDLLRDSSSSFPTSAVACSRPVLLGCHISRCVPFLSFTGPKCLASWPLWTRRTSSRSPSFPTVACTRLVLLRRPHAVVHMPVVCNDRCCELQSAENCRFSAVAALGKVVNIPVLVQTPIPMVLTV